MKTYSFKVVVEPDDDRWHAYCPALQQYGASTWGNTEEGAFKHIHEVVRMIIGELTVCPSDLDRWHAYCPALQQYGASTWGNTEEEAFKHIHEVVRMIIGELTV